MTPYMLYALTLALVGTLLILFIKKRMFASNDEQRLSEAATYTIIDATPKGEDL